MLSMYARRSIYALLWVYQQYHLRNERPAEVVNWRQRAKHIFQMMRPAVSSDIAFSLSGPTVELIRAHIQQYFAPWRC